MLISHVVTRDPRNRSRKKPADMSLATSVTQLGPNKTTHIEASKWTLVDTWVAGKPEKVYTKTTNGSPTANIPLLTATGIGLTYAISANESAALNKALEKLKDSRINLAVSVAELPETLKMFVNGGKVIVSAYKATLKKEKALRSWYERLRRSAEGKPSRKTSRQKAKLKKTDLVAQISSLWLGWRYGVMPLVYDVQGALEELQRPKETIGQLLRVKTSSRLVHEQAMPEYMRLKHGRNVMDTTGLEKLEVKITHSVVLNCVVVKPRTLTQLGLTNGLQVLWEVTPLSFVLDWWLNIGESLSTLDAGTGTSFVSGTLSEKREVVRKVPAGQYQLDSGHVYSYTWEGCESFEKTYNRRVLTSLPLPQFYVSNNMNAKRFTDAFALLKVILFSKK